MTLSRKSELKRTPFRNTWATKKKKATVPVKRLKSRQLAVTAEEKRLWDRLATEIGCVACMKDGRFNPHVSIHHVDGRTKPGCHKLVLPLCAPHHQHDDTDPAGRVGVHPWSSRFEALYGDQRELVALCRELLERKA